MMTKGQLLFLGTGASMGIPMIGCQCPVCQSSLPANKRLRSSVLIEVDNKTLLIDAGPDFRQQALQYDLNVIDGLILTHAHQDHIGGLDDLRPLYFKRDSSLPILLSAETARDIEIRFNYLFKHANPYNLEKHQCLELHVLPEKEGSIIFEGINIRYMSYEQLGMQVNGFRFGNLAYLSDIRKYSEDLFTHLEGVETLIISALRFTPSTMHLSVDEAIEFIKKVGPKKAWLTHIAHDLDHEKTNAYLPESIKLAHDGLTIEFGYEQ